MSECCIAPVCTLYSIPYALYTIHYTPYSILYTLCSMFYILCSILYAPYPLFYILYSLFAAPSSILYTPQSIVYTLYCMLLTLYSILHTPCSRFYTLYSMLHILRTNVGAHAPPHVFVQIQTHMHVHICCSNWTIRTLLSICNSHLAPQSLCSVVMYIQVKNLEEDTCIDYIANSKAELHVACIACIACSTMHSMLEAILAPCTY